jgi:hypothetical protein
MPEALDIGFFFNYKNQVIQLPVNPEKITVKFSGNNKTEEVLLLGEINILKERKLAAVNFASFFPYDSWLSFIRTKGSFESSQFYKDFFQRLMDNKEPARLVVTGPVGVNMMVSVESFEYDHTAGAHEDCNYSLELKEYRSHKIINLDPNTGKPLVSESQGNGLLSPSQFTINAPVYFTGVPMLSSKGKGAMPVRTNHPCMIGYIAKGEAYPYRLYEESSSAAIGWAKASMMVLR